MNNPFFAHILMTFTYFGKKCVFSGDLIIETIEENITTSSCLTKRNLNNALLRILIF